MNDAPRIRPITEHDWPGITALEAETYRPLGLSEGQAALRAGHDASPGTCFALHAERQLAGYVLALPYPAGSYPSLGAAHTPPPPSGNLHLHDLVIAPRLRRRGLARRLLGHLVTVAHAHAYERISLVSVGGTQAFWAARGFVPHPGVVTPGDYGPHAVYMSLSLTRPLDEASRARVLAFQGP